MLKIYIRTALRNLKANLSYTLLNIAGLSAAIAGSLLIFLFVRYHVITDKHHPEAGRIYRVVLDLLLDEGVEHGTGSSLALSRVLKERFAGVESAGFIRRISQVTLGVTSSAGEKRFLEKENAVFADQGFMDMFASEWAGRNPGKTMDEPGQAVITEQLARKYFGTSDVIGNRLKLDNRTDLQIAGVLKDHELPSDFLSDLYISLPTLKRTDSTYEEGNFHWISGKNLTFIRLAEGVDPAGVQKQLGAAGKDFYGNVAKYYDHQLQPLSEAHFDERYDGKIKKSVLWVLGTVGVFLLVIAGINFINMATAMAAKRSKEVGVRKVLGSSGKQLFMQFMTETFMVTSVSVILALLAVVLLMPVMNSWTETEAFRMSFLMNGVFIFFLLALVFFLPLTTGFYPAVILAGFNPVKVLKGRGESGSGGLTVRRTLVGVQLVIAHTLVIASVVLMLQLRFFMNSDPGFNSDGVAVISLPAETQGMKAMQAFRNELLQFPDLVSVAFQYEPPASGMGYGGSVRFDNRPDWEKFMIRDRFGDENFLKTYKIPLLAGRDLAGRDSATEFIVNEEFMKKAGVTRPEDMIGKQLEDGNSGLKGEIVGVARNFHIRSLQEAIEPCAVFSRPQLYREAAVRLNTRDITRSVSHLQLAWAKVYPQEVFSFRFMDQQMKLFYAKERQLTALIRVFAGLAVLICCLGLYGMVSFTVNRKTKEIGIRKVLGAGSGTIVLWLGKEFVILACVSFLIAAPAGWYLMRHWLDTFAYRIDLHWGILAVGGLFVLFITVLTVMFKVLKAAGMNPVKSINAG